MSDIVDARSEHEPRTYREALSMVAGAIKVCDAKKHYATRGIALRYGHLAKRHSGLILFPYRCVVCDEWHLTRQRRSGQANRL
jgi:hypothetical protein